METKVVYQHDEDGWFLNEVELNETDKSPLEEDVWLLPRNCVEKAPRKSARGKWPKWNGYKWVSTDLKKEEAEPKEEDQEEIDPIIQRKEAYKEADALKNEIEFDAMVSGEKPNYESWVKLVKEIKERYPKNEI
ncbi:MAG: hypothetical protein GOVbin1096_53 [Prokaryotic dsDNA virus sp.]|jgi:hypothetical protein|nr:MAG: hypothetical protein GOVbin1096_53 [Prokaryotic dsDNA virus sp.]|tara:strand:- start:70402 stop:70803 length:402 start_codon:yes stop_codon:yes gene_type:complete